MITAIAALAATFGTAEGIRASQTKSRREEHRSRKNNLVVHCPKSSEYSRILEGRHVVLSGDKLYLDTGLVHDVPFGHPFAGYYLPYPDTKFAGLVSSVTDEAPIMNWIYVDRETYEVKFGTRLFSEGNYTGPFDCTRQDRRLTFTGWEGFCAVKEGGFFALYFDLEGNNLRSKLPEGSVVIEIELIRKELRTRKPEPPPPPPPATGGEEGKPDEALKPEEKPNEASPANKEIIDEKIVDGSDLTQKTHGATEKAKVGDGSVETTPRGTDQPEHTASKVPDDNVSIKSADKEQVVGSSPAQTTISSVNPQQHETRGTRALDRTPSPHQTRELINKKVRGMSCSNQRPSVASRTPASNNMSNPSERFVTMRPRNSVMSKTASASVGAGEKRKSSTGGRVTPGTSATGCTAGKIAVNTVPMSPTKEKRKSSSGSNGARAPNEIPDANGNSENTRANGSNGGGDKARSRSASAANSHGRRSRRKLRAYVEDEIESSSSSSSPRREDHVADEIQSSSSSG